jgi:hypothetical protein
VRRRTFLLASAGALVGTLGIRFGFSSDSAAIAKIIRKRLPYLKIDDEGLRQFASDSVRQKLAKSLRIRTIDAAGDLYFRVTLSPGSNLGDKIRHTEDRVVTQFLLSSDFFINKADTNRTVRYVAYYDPMVACGNPFARPVVL